MSGGKPGATPRGDDANSLIHRGVVPGLPPRSLATFRLYPHGVRPRPPSSQSAALSRRSWTDAGGTKAIRPLAHTKRKRAKKVRKGPDRPAAKESGEREGFPARRVGERPVRPMQHSMHPHPGACDAGSPRGVNTERRAASRAALFRIRVGPAVRRPPLVSTHLLRPSTRF
jgi:hypothetical protein